MTGAYLDVSVGRRRARADVALVDEYLATGVVPGPGHGLLTGRYACYDIYSCADGGWLCGRGASSLASGATSASRSAASSGSSTSSTTPCRTTSAPTSRAAFKTKDARRVGGAARPGRHVRVAPVPSVPDLVADPQFARPDAFVEAQHPTAGDFRQVGPVLAGQTPADGPYVLRDARRRPTPRRCSTAAGLTATEVDDTARRRSGGVTDTARPTSSS